ncbi:MAG: type II toxin-antitoxin system RelE/ParE family toxin [Methylococcaceae bacterium]|nr:type II toxin-antitoxin system RelE/ParE family toxin [Methylococcaceae bacterium]
MKELVYKTRAKEDVKAAFNWYEQQKTGLGYDFLDNLEDSIIKIQHNPLLYPKTHKNLRRTLLKRFPYSLYYLLEDNIIYIFSVFDNRQNPEKLP